MNFYAFTWLMLGIVYGAFFVNAPTWIQAVVGMALGLLAAMWRLPKSVGE